MTPNKPQKPSYLSQVFDSKLFSSVIIVVGLAVIYTGSMMLFADWDTYDDPWSARGSNRFVFLSAAAILLVAFLVPLFKKSYRDQRSPSDKEASGFSPGQAIAYIGPLSDGRKIYGTYKGPSIDRTRVIISLDGLSDEAVNPSEVYNQ